MNNKYNNLKLNIKALLIIALILILFFLTACSKSSSFKTYSESVEYCYNKNITESCGIEKCIMLNSAEFNDNIKFTSEKNYYQCKLLECNIN